MMTIDIRIVKRTLGGVDWRWRKLRDTAMAKTRFGGDEVVPNLWSSAHTAQKSPVNPKRIRRVHSPKFMAAELGDTEAPTKAFVSIYRWIQKELEQHHV